MASPILLMQVPAVVCTVLGLIATFIALATPAWQVVYARELQQWLQSGLWMSCRTRPAGMYMCSYSFTHDSFESPAKIDEVISDASFQFYSWQRSLFHVFLVAQLSAILCLVVYFFSHNSEYKRVACIAIAILAALTALISCGALITFAVYSYMVEYRFYQVSVSGIYEKHRGYSFYVAFCGFIFYFLSFCFSLAYAVCVARKGPTNGGHGDVGQKAQHYPSYSVPQLSQEDYFAMRSLPDTPHRQQFRSTGF